VATALKILLAVVIAVLVYFGAKAGWNESGWFSAVILLLALLGGAWVVAMRRKTE
jgi:uncharacterized membrane protein YqjE